jgi:hypothetical protein
VIHDAVSVGKELPSIVFRFELSCRNMVCFGGDGDFRVKDDGLLGFVLVRLVS